ncbi:hypothetical protein SAMN03080594_10767 [Arenibacter palladensis]|uniref:Uncharacterized protein n=1 Tax=Arenibacter palladensis TaxID=237373 RepID=A0A1M5EBZ9_9FLAO|nr:hypothetical protein SAMN03080594_10767 [Arenibacter palladensis]
MDRIISSVFFEFFEMLLVDTLLGDYAGFHFL